MKQVQRSSVRLADDTGNKLVALWALTEKGDLSRARFRALSAGLVAAANMQGVALADLGLTAEVIRQLRRPTAPLGLRPTSTQIDQDRIVASIDRILDGTDEPASQFHRLGRSETLLTVAAAIQVGMIRRNAKGWTRQLTATSCELCEEWADGKIRAATTRMARHLGCDCIQQPEF